MVNSTQTSMVLTIGDTVAVNHEGRVVVAKVVGFAPLEWIDADSQDQPRSTQIPGVMEIVLSDGNALSPMDLP